MSKKHDNERPKPFLRLRKTHQILADALNMTTEQYITYRKKIEDIEEERRIKEHPIVTLKFKNQIDLIENFEQLGYSKHFLTRDDAEFLFDKMMQWEEDNSYMEISYEGEVIDRDKIISTYMATGVKYDFKNIALTLYMTFGFSQSNYYNCGPSLDYIPEQFLYNHRSKEFIDIREHDCTDIFFK